MCGMECGIMAPPRLIAELRPPIRQDAPGVYIPARVRSVFEARHGAKAGSPDSRT